eukprot:c29385_g1_i5 orf=109-378(+)
MHQNLLYGFSSVDGYIGPPKKASWIFIKIITWNLRRYCNIGDGCWILAWRGILPPRNLATGKFAQHRKKPHPSDILQMKLAAVGKDLLR